MPAGDGLKSWRRSRRRSEGRCLDFSDQLKRATLERFRTDLKEVRGATDFIRRFSHIPRAIASSSSIDRLQLCLSVLGLEAEFGNHVYSADMVARGKPHPDIFLYAANKFGVTPSECLVIEDSAGGDQGGRCRRHDRRRPVRRQSYSRRP